MNPTDQLFILRYRFHGQIWATVENAPDAKPAATRFQRLHPHVELVSCGHPAREPWVAE